MIGSSLIVRRTIHLTDRVDYRNYDGESPDEVRNARVAKVARVVDSRKADELSENGKSN